MSRLTDLSLRNRALVALATVVIALMGVVSAVTLKQELMPPLQFPVLAAATSVPGADAQVVEALVTTPVEQAAMALDEVKKVESTSSAGASVVTVTLDYGADVKAARADQQAATAGLTGQPVGVHPRVVAGNLDDFPVIYLSATGADAPDDLVAALNSTVIPDLNRIDGVRDVQVIGVAPKAVTITLDPARAQATGVTLPIIAAALAGNGVTVPAGSVNDGANALNVQVGSAFATVDDLMAIPLLGAVPPTYTGFGSAIPQATANAPVRAAPGPAPYTYTCSLGGPGTCTFPPQMLTCTVADAAGGICTVPGDFPATATTTTTATSVTTTTLPGTTTTRTTTRTVTPPVRTSTVRVSVPSYVTVQAPAPTPTPPPPPPTLGEVATVTVADAPASGYVRTDGEPAVSLGIRRTADGNTVDISQDVRAKLAEYQRATGGRVTVVYDQGPYIERSIRDLIVEGLLGLLFAVLVVLAFLWSVRMTLITAVSIPLSLLIALIGLRGGGQSLNILTLAALTIAVGRVVDDSIVVVENIKRHVDRGDDALASIPTAVREVAGAITSSTLATAAVFLPLGLVGGQVGQLFRPFAFTVVLALLASLLVALTIIPVLAWWLLKRRAAGRPAFTWRKPKPAAPPRVAAGAAMPPTAASTAETTNLPPVTTMLPAVDVTPPGGAPVGETSVLPPVTATPAGTGSPAGTGTPAETGAPGQVTLAKSGQTGPLPPVGSHPPTAAPVVTGPVVGRARPVVTPRPDRLRAAYLSTLAVAMRLPLVTLGLALLILLGTAAAATQLKTDFLGTAGQDSLVITQELPVGTSLEATDLAATKVELVLEDRRDLAGYQVNIGDAADPAGAFTGGAGAHRASYYLLLKEDVDSAEVAAALQANLDRRPELGRFTVGSGDPAQTTTVQVTITGPNDAKLAEASDRVFNRVRKVPGATQVASNFAQSLPSLQVVVDRQAAAAAGLTEAQVGQIVTAALRGAPIGQVSVDGQALTAVVTSPSTPLSVDDLRVLPVGDTTLGALAQIDEVTSPTTLVRVDGVRTATVSAVPGGDDLGGFTEQVTDAVRKSNLPAGTTATIGGVAAEQREAFGQLGWALLAAILLVYLVMVATFRSLVQPLLLLVSIPFAATGAVALLLVTGTPLGVAALVGVLMLIGIVVTNAIVLVDLVNRYRTGGQALREAILTGAGNRLRPILMTALATIFALIPMAFAFTGGGAFISQPLAIVVIGGLVSSTVLTLIIVPVLYHLVEGWAERRAARKAGTAPPRPPSRLRMGRGKRSTAKAAAGATTGPAGAPGGGVAVADRGTGQPAGPATGSGSGTGPSPGAPAGPTKPSGSTNPGAPAGPAKSGRPPRRGLLRGRGRSKPPDPPQSFDGW